MPYNQGNGGDLWLQNSSIELHLSTPHVLTQPQHLVSVAQDYCSESIGATSSITGRCNLSLGLTR